MDPDRWRKVESLFEAALAAGPGRRSAYLEENCRDDDELRQLVESLVLHGENAAGFLEAPPVEQALTGQRVLHYRIQEKLGEGGMGAVYKALDTKLSRPVALKFLHSELEFGEDARGALINEARSASALDHPNIGTIYGIEETGHGHPFIVMAYYAGQTLAQKLRSGPIPPAEAASISIQVAAGLAEAHAHQIIHRDIKPSNIFLTGQGLVKILDFGIARAIRSAASTRSVNPLGTAAYMSPEQVTGGFLDARTDLWSLGTVLYQMVAGRRPFGGDLPATLFAIVHEPPTPLGEDVPPAIRKVVYHALAKEPEHRYASARAMVQDLRGVTNIGVQPYDPTADTRKSASTRSGLPARPGGSLV